MAATAKAAALSNGVPGNRDQRTTSIVDETTSGRAQSTFATRRRRIERDFGSSKSRLPAARRYLYATPALARPARGMISRLGMYIHVSSGFASSRYGRRGRRRLSDRTARGSGTARPSREILRDSAAPEAAASPPADEFQHPEHIDDEVTLDVEGIRSGLSRLPRPLRFRTIGCSSPAGTARDAAGREFPQNG